MKHKLQDIDLIWGDLHLGDNGMFKRTYSKTFKTKERYFEAIIKNHNQAASEDSVILFLGDLGRKENFDVFDHMKGYKILIKGNHDNYSNDVYERYFNEIYEYGVFIRARILATHIPTPVEPGVLNVHGHIHTMFINDEHYINVCPEHTEYKPVPIKRILKKLQHYKKPSYKFLEEWFKDMQIAPPREDLVLNEDSTINVKETLKLKKSREDEKI